MKTLKAIAKDYKSETLDGRDMNRLMAFVPDAQWKDFGFELEEGTVRKVTPFTRDNVLIQLKVDVDFGFEKALNKRGISASLMFEVVCMWNWILEEGLENYDSNNDHEDENGNTLGYAQYGLPLFKATALKYGFPNPIGDDAGDEFKYSAEGDN